MKRQRRKFVLLHVACCVALWLLSSPCSAQHSIYDPIVDRIMAREEREQSLFEQQFGSTIPGDWQPWWNPYVAATIRGDHPSVAPIQSLNVESLIASALQYSDQIRVFSDVPLIRETSIEESEGTFDARQFAESNYIDTNTPVGSLLTTGGAPRFSDHNWTSAAGVRRKNTRGGQFEVSQRFGFQDNNSNFFSPRDQGTAKLTLRYTQPLLNGAGKTYNTSLITLAKIDTQMAKDELSRQLQSHLLEVTRAYWSLYQQRANYLQKLRSLERARAVREELRHRQSLDALPSSLARADAVVAMRESDMIRTYSGILNAESRLRSLVNAPHFYGVEVVPTESPAIACPPVEIRESLLTALDHRAEIAMAAKQVQQTSIRVSMATAEKKSQLNLVSETYMSGLQPHADVGQSFVDQFSIGQPSYSVGLFYEKPWNNSAARARLRRRELEMRQAVAQFHTSAETILLEVEIAAREVNTSSRDMHAKYLALVAAANELYYREERWHNLPEEQLGSSSALENLLDSQDRLLEAEEAFVEAQVLFGLSKLNLEKSQGTLLTTEAIQSDISCQDGLPTYQHQMYPTEPELINQPAPMVQAEPMIQTEPTVQPESPDRPELPVYIAPEPFIPSPHLMPPTSLPGIVESAKSVETKESAVNTAIPAPPPVSLLPLPTAASIVSQKPAAPLTTQQTISDKTTAAPLLDKAPFVPRKPPSVQENNTKTSIRVRPLNLATSAPKTPLVDEPKIEIANRNLPSTSATSTTTTTRR